LSGKSQYLRYQCRHKKIITQPRCRLARLNNRNFRLTSASEAIADRGKLKPLREYLMTQGRFQNISEEQIDWLQEWVNHRWQHFLERAARAR